MFDVDSIYDSRPIMPVCKIKENMSIWTRGKWEHYNVTFQEPIPRASPMIVDMVALAPGQFLPAAGTIAKQAIAVLGLGDLEFLHLRWEPLDSLIEGVLWEQSGSGRFITSAVHSRVSPYSSQRDPYLAQTTFWILGLDRNMNLEVRNLSPAYAMMTARFMFSGYRYLLESLTDGRTDLTPDQRTKLALGDVKTVKDVIGATTWLPAEGR